MLLGYTEHSDTVIAIQRTTCRILHFSRPDLVIDLVHNLVAKSLATDSIEDLRDAAWHLMEAKLDPASVEVEVDVYWDNLATAFRYHFIALENTSALADCIRCTEQALWLRPLGHPQRNESLQLFLTTPWT